MIPMRIQQIVWKNRAGWTAGTAQSGDASLVVYFGTRAALACGARYDEMRSMFPTAHILGCSTGGQINNDYITDMKSLRRPSVSMRPRCDCAGRTSADRSSPAPVAKKSAAHSMPTILPGCSCSRTA
jgi:hypothetical protein